MSRGRFIAVAGVMATALAITPLATSIEQTDARWFDSTTASLPDGATDRFTSSVTDTTRASEQIGNTPSLAVSNNAERHQGWTNVLGVSLGSGQLGGQNLASDLGLTYRVTPPGGTCTAGTSAYWTARQSGQITLGDTYDRPQDRIAAALIAAGQANSLCLTLPFNGSDRNFLLEHAGRDLVVRTAAALRSEGPATWDSGPETVDSTYRVAFPRATPRNNNFNSLAESCSSNNNTVQVRWAWPDATATATANTPAVAEWELWGRVRNTTGPWQLFNQTDGNNRTLSFARSVLGNSAFEIKIVAVPNASSAGAKALGDGKFFVEGTHLIYVSGQNGCNAVASNTRFLPGGPVVLP